jgi:hypothetical protein
MVTSAAAFAQASVSLGLKGGLNFANVNTSSVGAAYNSRTGYHAGAFVNIKLTKLAIQPEVIYSVQGSDISMATSSQALDLAYVNIPVILKFYLIGGLNLQAGPQFGFLASASGPDPTGTVTGAVDLKSYLKSTDFSIGLGAGFDISKFTIDARYNLGMSEINDNAALSAAKNQAFQLSLGFKLFDFGN